MAPTQPREESPRSARVAVLAGLAEARRVGLKQPAPRSPTGPQLPAEEIAVALYWPVEERREPK